MDSYKKRQTQVWRRQVAKRKKNKIALKFLAHYFLVLSRFLYLALILLLKSLYFVTKYILKGLFLTFKYLDIQLRKIGPLQAYFNRLSSFLSPLFLKFSSFFKRIFKNFPYKIKHSFLMRNLLLHKRRLVAASLLLFIFVFVSFYKSFGVDAATYYWQQSDWSGGESGESFGHNDGRTGLDVYASKSGGLDAGTSLTLPLQDNVVSDNQQSDFEAGSLDYGAALSGQGADASLSLASGVATFSDWRSLQMGELGLAITSTSLLASNEQTALVSSGNNLYSIDISDPAHPALLDSLSNTYSISILTAYGNYFYVLDSSYRLRIIDASNPADISFVNTIVFPSSTRFIISGSYLYLFYSNNFSIYDLANPVSPSLLGTMSGYMFYTAMSDNFAVYGDYFYFYGNAIGSTSRYLYVVNASDKSAPVVVTYYNEIVDSLEIIGDYLYFNYNSRLMGKHIEQSGAVLATTTVASFMNCPTYPYSKGLKSNGTYLYLYGVFGLRVFTTEADHRYEMFQSTNIPGSLNGVSFVGGNMLALDVNFGLRIYNVSSLSAPTFLSQLSSSNEYANIRETYIQNGLAYGISVNYGFYIFNVSDPNNISFRNKLYLSGMNSLVLRDNIAFISGGTYFLVLDVSNPDNIVTLSNTSLSSDNGRKIEIAGNYAYISTGGRLDVYDISNLGSLSLLSSHNLPSSSVRDIVEHEGVLYVGTGSGVVAIDISNPLDLADFDSISTNPSGLFAEGDFLYVGLYSSGLAIIDISNVSDLRLLSSLTTYGLGNERKIVKAGGLFYLLERGHAVYVFDIPDSSHINMIGMLGEFKYPYSMSISGNIFYIFDGDTNKSIASYRLFSYAPQGTFTSRIFETNNISFGELNWSASLPTGTSASMKVRSANNAGMSGAANWSTCNELSAGEDISDSLCVIDSQSYLQYQLILRTTDPLESPLVDSTSLHYEAHSPGELISVPYDSNSDANLIAGLRWQEEEAIPSGAGVVIYFRSAADASVLSTAPWQTVATSTSDYLSPGCVKEVGQVDCNQDSIPTAMRDGASDRWFQYRISLLSSGHFSSSLDAFDLKYVVNASPEIQSFSATQEADGRVKLSYSVRDADTGDGTATPGELSPSFEYWDGENWQPCLSFTEALANVDVESQDFTEYESFWLPKTDLDNFYAENFIIRLKVNDNEAANNITSLSANSFVLDTKSPEIEFFQVDARNDATQNIHLSALDDSVQGLSVKISNHSDLSADGLNTSSGEWVAYSEYYHWNIENSQAFIYYQVKDAFGNISANGAISNLQIPQAPANILYQDISNISTEEWREFIAWGESSIPLANFHSYKVFSSTNGGSFTELVELSDRQKNFYIDYALDEDLDYSYKAVVIDNSGNISQYSDVVSDRPDGQGGSDFAPPVISDISVDAITTQSARISWQTDEPSDSIVDFIATSGGDFSQANSRGLTAMADQTDGLGRHYVVLDNLQPDLTYYFQVRSRDPRGNEALARTEPDSYSFHTLAGPTISNVTVVQVSNNRAEIHWQTDVASESFVYYAQNPGVEDFQRSGTANSVTDHQVIIEGLTMGKTYYFYVQSGVAEDKNASNGQINYYSFITGADIQAPSVYFDQEDDLVIEDNSANISWQTSEPSKFVLSYGLDESYGNDIVDDGYNTSHYYKINNLTKGTLYYVRIVNLDENGNGTDPLTFSFSTTDSTDYDAPVISNIETSSIYDHSALISFMTDEPSSAILNYGQASGEYTESVVANLSNRNHSFALSGLSPQTAYFFQISVSDVNDNEALSEEGSFSTLSTLVSEQEALAREEAAKKASAGGGTLIIDKNDKVAPIISEVSASPSFDSISLSWQTDELADSFLEFGFAGNYDGSSGSREQVSEHRLKISNLLPSQEYSIKISSADASGNVSDVYTLELKTLSMDEALSELEDLTEGDSPEDNLEDTAVNDSKFISVLNKTIDFIKQAAKHVSLSVLESSLNEQQKMIGELSSLTPAPKLLSEPKVQTWEDMAVVSWQTDKKSSSLLSFADTQDKLQSSPSLGDPNSFNTSHQVVITGLSSDATYFYQIKGATPAGASLASSVFRFLTNMKTAKVENYSVNKIDDNSASFRWLSSVPTDTSVHITPYRNNILVPEESRSFRDASVATLHELTVVDFEPGTFYKVELSGSDKNGDLISQSIDSFSTSEDELPFSIDQVKVDSALSIGNNSQVQEIISWTTSRPAKSKIYYRRGVEKDNDNWTDELSIDDSYSRSHLAVITNFEPGVVYQFQIVNFDYDGEELRSKIYSILTPRQKDSVFQIIVKNIEETFGWVSMMK